MICIKNYSTDPYYNLALEEYLLKNYDKDIFMLWRNERSIIVGKYQNTVAEINTDFVQKHQLKIVRRITGGGAVFHDLGNINFTFIKSKNNADFHTFTEPIIQALNALGIPATFQGRNDIAIYGQKISGNAQCIYENRILHHGTLLYSAQMNDLQEALLVNPLKFQGKSVQSVRKRVTNICDYLSSPMSVEQFIDYLYTYIIQHIPGTQYVSISKQDQSAIHQLRDKKYVTWEWNYGHSPQFTFHKSAKTAGGIIEVFLDISEGNIQSMHLCGDFFADQDISKLEQYFFNKRYDLASLSEMLQSISISSYIRNVTNEEFLQLLF